MQSLYYIGNTQVKNIDYFPIQTKITLMNDVVKLVPGILTQNFTHSNETTTSYHYSPYVIIPYRGNSCWRVMDIETGVGLQYTYIKQSIPAVRILQDYTSFSGHPEHGIYITRSLGPGLGFNVVKINPNDFINCTHCLKYNDQLMINRCCKLADADLSKYEIITDSDLKIS